MPLTSWHRDWQGRFAGHTEVSFAIQEGSGQARNRKADLDLHGEWVVEFQHSPMSIISNAVAHEDRQRSGEGYRVDT